jgi:hypothetical protein
MAETKKHMCAKCRTDNAAWCDAHTERDLKLHTHVCESCGARVTFEADGPACAGPVISDLGAPTRPTDEVYQRQHDEFVRAGEELGKYTQKKP